MTKTNTIPDARGYIGIIDTNAAWFGNVTAMREAQPAVTIHNWFAHAIRRSLGELSDALFIHGEKFVYLALGGVPVEGLVQNDRVTLCRLIDGLPVYKVIPYPETDDIREGSTRAADLARKFRGEVVGTALDLGRQKSA